MSMVMTFISRASLVSVLESVPYIIFPHSILFTHTLSKATAFFFNIASEPIYILQRVKKYSIHWPVSYLQNEMFVTFIT